MSVLTYALLLEIEPGVLRPAIACNAEDMARAHALEVRKVGLYAQVELLIADAARYGLPIPPEVRERASECRGNLRLLEAVRAELEDALLAPI